MPPPRKLSQQVLIFHLGAAYTSWALYIKFHIVILYCNNNLSELNVVNSQLDADDDDFTLDF